MKKSKAVTLSPARDFFNGELYAVMRKRQIDAAPGSVEYLVDLLIRFIDTESLFTRNDEGRLENPILARIFAEYAQATLEQRRTVLKRLGDVCMMLTGFFGDSVRRRPVDVDYYFDMGGAAYSQLSQVGSGMTHPVFQELSIKFKQFSDVLSELSERSGFQSNIDLLRLYEKWIQTGSERIRETLTKQGISTPVKLDTKIRH